MCNLDLLEIQIYSDNFKNTVNQSFQESTYMTLKCRIIKSGFTGTVKVWYRISRSSTFIECRISIIQRHVLDIGW